MSTTRKRKGERPDGLIQVSLVVGRDENGKYIRKYFYGHTRSEAEIKRKNYKAHMVSGAKYSKNMTVHEWVVEYKKTYRQNVNPAYINMDDVPYNRLIDEMGYKAIADVTEADLQQALNKVAGMSFSTCDKYRQAIKRLFERARKNKIIAENPANDLVLPQHTKGTHRALETWEIDAILKHWNEPGLHAGLWIMVMLLSGLRRGEMMALEWKDVHLDERVLDVVQVAVISGNRAIIEHRAKSAAGIRTIPLCKPLWAALASVPESKRVGLVCLSAHEQPLTESAVSRGIETFCNGIRRILSGQPALQPGRRKKNDCLKAVTFSFRAHDLRHTFCSMLYSSGVDVKTAAYLMGHSDIRVTMEIYTHLSHEKRNMSEMQMLSYFDALTSQKTP